MLHVTHNRIIASFCTTNIRLINLTPCTDPEEVEVVKELDLHLMLLDEQRKEILSVDPWSFDVQAICKRVKQPCAVNRSWFRCSIGKAIVYTMHMAVTGHVQRILLQIAEACKREGAIIQDIRSRIHDGREPSALLHSCWRA